MTKSEEILSKILNDLRIELADEFDKNFERKAFFDKKWKERQRDGNGTLLLVTGKLRRSIKSQIKGNSIVFSSSEPYASIHNFGGTITVTEKMKKYFWAKYYELAGKIEYTKKGSVKHSARNYQISDLAMWYKNMALMKVGSKIHIPQRQFIGDHPQVDKLVKDVIDDNINEELEVYIKSLLQPKHKRK
ncbi:MAG: phage virion morphogenesis protein [Bacteroidales bacterium]|nr:phage virion morphogenesis protein [Bacteroidales bacterium]